MHLFITPTPTRPGCRILRPAWGFHFRVCMPNRENRGGLQGLLCSCSKRSSSRARCLMTSFQAVLLWEPPYLQCLSMQQPFLGCLWLPSFTISTRSLIYTDAYVASHLGKDATITTVHTLIFQSKILNFHSTIAGVSERALPTFWNRILAHWSCCNISNSSSSSLP